MGLLGCHLDEPWQSNPAGLQQLVQLGQTASMTTEFAACICGIQSSNFLFFRKYDCRSDNELFHGNVNAERSQSM